jgi:putative transcriptional regulator
MSSQINHHPDGATLMSYAAATLVEPLAAVVASHLSMCPRCRAEVADCERLGAALLLAAPCAGDASPLNVAVPRPKATARATLPRHGDDRLPAALVAAYDLSWDTIPWRRLSLGVWHHRLPLQQASEGDLRLLRIAAGAAMPDHGHGGSELTLVLQGAYRDVTGEYRCGDVQDVDPAIEHSPVVSNDGECVCLIASEQPARFKTFLGRISQPWTGL